MIAADVATPLTIHGSLRSANDARQAEWDSGGNIDLSYAGCELAGEVSEAIAEASMLLDDDDDDRRDLADELADVVICVDLIARRVAIEPIPLTISDEPKTIEQAQMWVNELGSDLQLVCNTIKKLERERHGMPGSRADIGDLTTGLWCVQFDACMIAQCFGIDLPTAVVRKFNSTSEKVGLKTWLVL